MNIKMNKNRHQKKVFISLAVLVQVLGLFLVLNTYTYAEPRAITITCNDGTTVSVDTSSATTSYVTACGTHGYTLPATNGGTTPSDTVDPLKGIDSVNLTPTLDSKDGSFTASSNKCGSGSKVVDVSFNFGCLGPGHGELNPITDIAFAIFRFLSAGVGLIVIGSVIVAGIQYTASRGNPQAIEASIKRISNAIIGLLIYVFMFAIANFLVPGGMF